MYKRQIINDGCCPIHNAISEEQVRKAKNKHPEALVLSHPECDGAVLTMSDYIGSTAEIINYAKSSDMQEFIICTEEGLSLIHI